MKQGLKEIKMPETKALQLRDEEKKALSKIAGDGGAIQDILQEYCYDTMDFVRVAIHNPLAREWCRNNNQERWQSDLKKLGQFSTFKCEFKIPKKLKVFDLLAGSLLINEYLCEKNQKNQIVILYIAMQMFNSIHATCELAKMTIDILRTHEELEIKSMLQYLETSASIHGSPGYLLYSWFNQKVGEYYLGKKLRVEAAQAFNLGYQFLLTAAKLETRCAAEMNNATYGNLPKFLQAIEHALDSDSSQPFFSSMVSRYESRFSLFISGIKLAAEQKALQLTQDWIGPVKK